MAAERRDALPDPAEKAVVVEAMFDRIAPRYDRMNRLLSLGLDRRWRRRAVSALGLDRGARVLDLACGTGDLCRELTGRGITAIGIDVSAGMLRHARTTAPLVRADGARLPVPDRRIDGITCGFALRNLTDLPAFLAECARVLRPGGRIALIEVAEPRNRILKAGHTVWFRRIVPFVGGLFSDRAAYAYLPQSTAYLPPPTELAALVAAAGFTDVRRTLLAPGASQLLVATRRGG